jgi:predicted RNase H-like HicB family nuclease
MAQSVEEKGPITYSAVLTPGDDSGSCAQIAEVPEAISQGRTLDEANANVTEALELALEWRRGEGEPLPEPHGAEPVPGRSRGGHWRRERRGLLVVRE